MICAGIDAGSRALKIALFDAQRRCVVAAGKLDQGIDHDERAVRLFEELIRGLGLRRQDVRRIIATGYARNRIHLADSTVTEITCHARGVRHQADDAMTVIEIGGQDSKLLRLESSGNVRDFAMNDRCAAGTGRFLEAVATQLDARLEDLGELAGRSRNPAVISSTCVVFAETEIIGLLASGVPREDIVAGVQNAMAARIAAMTGGELMAPIYFTGGVALVGGMRQALESALGQPLRIAPDPQMTGAIGAAMLAASQLHADD